MSRKNFAVKVEDMKKKLKNPKSKWKTLDVKSAKDSVPTMLNNNSESITSQKKIVEVMSKYFCNRVNTIKKTFDSDEEKDMTILKKLTKKRSNEFEFKKLTRAEVYKILLKTKASKTVANAAIPMDFLKQIPQAMSLILTHLFNKIIETKKFPEALRIT